MLQKSQYIDSAILNIDTAIGDIEAILSANNGNGVAQYSAFILISCVLDYLANYRYIKDIPDKNGSSKQSERYITFVNRYLNNIDNRYQGEDFYKYIRCGLVHSFRAIKNGKMKYWFGHAMPARHLGQETHDGETRTVLDVGSLLNDIKRAKDAMFKEAYSDPAIEANIKTRVNEIGRTRRDIGA